MDSIFTNSENGKTSDPQRKYLALTNRSMYYTWKNIKVSYKNNKFEISVPIWNYKFELPERSYSVSLFKITLGISSKKMK